MIIWRTGKYSLFFPNLYLSIKKDSCNPAALSTHDIKFFRHLFHLGYFINLIFTDKLDLGVILHFLDHLTGFFV
ncbi:hypothetical protein [Mesobacillus sp.]|uniref:hypothetical protein n=1 Tax=Mesobacillus sp. TaxID=2675271 RepID=UPI003C6FD17C